MNTQFPKHDVCAHIQFDIVCSCCQHSWLCARVIQHFQRVRTRKHLQCFRTSVPSSDLGEPLALATAHVLVRTPAKCSLDWTPKVCSLVRGPAGKYNLLCVYICIYIYIFIVLRNFIIIWIHIFQNIMSVLIFNLTSFSVVVSILAFVLGSCYMFSVFAPKNISHLFAPYIYIYIERERDIYIYRDI